MAHRIIWLISYGKMPAGQIDHIDGDRLNNRLDNLRDVSGFTNQKNAKRSAANKSGFTGVSWKKKTNRWVSQIKIDGIVYHIGYYKNLSDAVQARVNTEIANGFHVNHGRG